MSEVGALIIKLQAETAQFRSDMGKVKSDLDDLGSKGTSAGAAMGGGMREARGSLMLIEESVGTHLPRELNTLLATIPGVGAAFAAMLPLVGVVAAIVIIGKLIDKHKELKEESEKITQSQNAMAGTIATTMRGLEDKFLQAGIKADELRGDHLAALKKQLELIDHQSLDELEKTFDTFAKTADAAFVQLQAHWYQFGNGSDRAKHNLAEFQSQYDLLLAQGKTTEANSLLQDRVKYEQQILNLAKQVAASYSPEAFKLGDYLTKDAAKINELKAAGAGISEKELTSQQDLVDILNSQVSAHQKIAATTNLEKSTDTGEVTKQINLKKLQSWDAATKAATKYTNAVDAAGAADQRRGHLGPSPEDIAAIAAIDPLMANALDSTKRESAELGQLHTYYEQLAEAEKNVVKAQEEQNATLKTDAIDRQIEAYQKLASEGLISQQQLAAKLKPLYQQETDDKMAAIKAEIAQQKNIELAAQASGDAIKTDRAKADEIKLQTQLEQIRQKGVAQQATLDVKQGADFQKMATQETQAWNNAVVSWVVSGGNFAEKMRQMGAKMLTDAINYAVQETVAKEEQWAIQKIKKLFFGVSSAAQTIATNKTEATAAAGLAGANMMATVALAPWPIDMTAPAQAAAALTAAMGMAAFEMGGKIPGAGAVPILGHGGETVVTKALTDRVEQAEGRGRGDMHLHNTFAPQIHAVDAEGVDRMLMKHGAVFQRHITSTIRRMNK